MSQRFYKGRTNNHLTWAMVDATDFATPESALSAATKIKIYGKLRSGTGVNFVSSGTGSLTNDIIHVGASALGLYTIALAKADLSDASAAWYDQYVISLSATGAAYQALIVDGGINDSDISDALSNLLSRITKAVATNSQLSDLHSDLKSYLAVMSDVLSDTRSKIIVMSGIQSDIYSLLSDHHSDFQSRVPKVVATNSQLSDLASDLKSYLIGMSGMLSDVDSAVTSQYSDIASKVGAITVTLTASDISDIASAVAAVTGTPSDIASKVWAEKYTAASNVKASTFGSMMRLNMSRISDVQSYLVVMSAALSDVDSAVNSQYSDLASKIGAITATVSASDISDIASAVKVAMASDISDIYSGVTALQSRITGAVATASDVASKVWAEKYTAASNVKASTFGSALRLNMSRISDLQSYVAALSATISDAHSAAILAASNASDAYSVALINRSMISDLDSALTSQYTVYGSDISDIRSMLTALSGMISDVDSAMTSQYTVYGSDISDIRSMLTALSGMVSDVDSAVSSQFAATSNYLSGIHSDLGSKIGNVSVAITASDISDIASAVAAAVGFTPSDIASHVWNEYPGTVLDANIVSVAGTTVTGTGTAGDPWGP